MPIPTVLDLLIAVLCLLLAAACWLLSRAHALLCLLSRGLPHLQPLAPRHELLRLVFAGAAAGWTLSALVWLLVALHIL